MLLGRKGHVVREMPSFGLSYTSQEKKDFFPFNRGVQTASKML